jgi:hypothetical protein
MFRVLRGVCFAVGALLLTAGVCFAAYRGWLAAGPDSPLGPTELAPGIVYRRVPLQKPRRAVAHVLQIDLAAPQLRMTITPKVLGVHCMPARRTSDFLVASKSVVAINGAFFHPFWSKGPWNYYPHEGDCTYVLGRWSAQGQKYGQKWKGVALSFGPGLEPTAGRLADAPWTVEGKTWLVKDQVVLRHAADEQDAKPYPRNVMCIAREPHSLLSILVDGRQPGYSDGLTLGEVAEFAAQQGCAHAIELDGGGSVSMAWRSPHGVVLLNRPVHTRVPGRERPVANHIGFGFGTGPGE